MTDLAAAKKHRLAPLNTPTPTPRSNPSQGLETPVITAMQPASPTMPATDRSNSRTRMERPRPNATRPKVANNCITLKTVPMLKKYPVPRSIRASTTIEPNMTVKGRTSGPSRLLAARPIMTVFRRLYAA